MRQISPGAALLFRPNGNIPGKIRSQPSNKAHLLLALLPIPPKVIGDTASKGRLRAWVAETLRSVLSVVLEPLLHFDQSAGILMGCSDGYERRCWPILAAWLADHVENCNLLSTKFNMCLKCEIPVNKLGEYQAVPHKIYAWDQGEYRRMDEKRELKTLAKWFEKRGLRPLYNPFWDLPFVQAYELYKPEMLHVIYLGILKHLMQWLEDFLQEFDRLDGFNLIWTKMPPYPGFARRQNPTKPNPSDSQAEPFSKDFQCVGALIDWGLVAQYRSHNELTLDLLDGYLRAFHRMKDIFMKYRANQETEGLVAKRCKELREEYNAELAALEESSTQRRRVIAGQRLNLQAETDEILRYGNIPDYSTESCETAHGDQLKIPYCRSNHVNAAMQILRTFNRDYIFAMHGLNLLQIAWDGFSTRELANPQDDLAIQVGLIAPLGCFPKEEPVEKRLVKTPIHLTVVKSVNIPARGKSLEFYIRRYFMRELRRDFDEIPEDIDTWSVTTFRQLEVPVFLHGAGDKRTVHTLHTTGTADYRRGEARNDCVWFCQKPADLEPLKGLCPATLLAVFKLRDPEWREARLLAAI
ncbi:hypothetical protein DFP73DRAFT_599509 [Morchella snyderi]|nr:hypothetical protein DFP73DRAFT_599509 [Morchella snyderi]